MAYLNAQGAYTEPEETEKYIKLTNSAFWYVCVCPGSKVNKPNQHGPNQHMSAGQRWANAGNLWPASVEHRPDVI